MGEAPADRHERLGYIKYNTDGTFKSSVDKFFDEAKLKVLAQAAMQNPAILILIFAGNEERTRKAMSELRLELGERLGLRKKDEFKLLWVLDFPLFEYAEEENRLGSTTSSVYISQARSD